MISAINNFSKVSFGSISSQKTEPTSGSSSQKQDTAELNCDPSQKLLVKKQQSYLQKGSV